MSDCLPTPWSIDTMVRYTGTLPIELARHMGLPFLDFPEKKEG
jgi:hypothetical protein